MPSWSKARTTLFAHPRYSASAIWLVITIGYLIPSFIKLLPLGELDDNAQSRRDDAQTAYSNVLNELKGVQEKIREAKMRVENLDCAIIGYTGFNHRAKDFQKNMNESMLPALDKLNQIGKMHFFPDKTTTDKSTKKLSWTTMDWQYDYYYSCAGQHTCGKEKNCCYHWGHHYVTNTHYYNEITIITNHYLNVLQGGPFHIDPLTCGYYSRDFNLLPPSTVMTHESQHSSHGSKEKGTTYVEFSRDWGSSVSASYRLDEQVVKVDFAVLRTVNPADAAADLIGKLFHFLATCITAIEAVGANYPALQEKIRQSIPGLVEQSTALNATLQEKALVLASEENRYRLAHDDYKEGQAIWLSQLFLVPLAVASFAFFTILYLKNRPEVAENVSNSPSKIEEVEKGQVTHKTSTVLASAPPANSPRYFNSNLSKTTSAEIGMEKGRLSYASQLIYGK